MWNYSLVVIINIKVVRLRVKVRTDVEISWHFVHPAQQEIPQLACPF